MRAEKKRDLEKVLREPRRSLVDYMTPEKEHNT
jgi:hypothetical protein